jgi:hypothetical protein
MCNTVGNGSSRALLPGQPWSASDRRPLHGNPFDGHTLQVAEVERGTDVENRRTDVDRKYLGPRLRQRIRSPADHRRHQARDEAPRRCRTGERPPHGRPSHGSRKTSTAGMARPRLTRPRRRRFQIPPPPVVAGRALARDRPGHPRPPVSLPASLTPYVRKNFAERPHHCARDWGYGVAESIVEA